jgi:hypothetical protein
MATIANSTMSMARSVPWKASSTAWFAGRWIPNTMTAFLGETRAAHPDEFLLIAAGGGCSPVAKELVVAENIRPLRPAALCPGTQSPRTHLGSAARKFFPESRICHLGRRPRAAERRADSPRRGYRYSTQYRRRALDSSYQLEHSFEWITRQ